MKKNTGICALGLAAAMVIGSVSTGIPTTQAVQATGYDKLLTSEAATGQAVTPEETSMKLNHTSVNKMAGKSFKLTVSNLSSVSSVSFTSTDEAVATVKDQVYAADQTSASATISLLKAGKATINVDVNGTALTCDVKVVAKFGKKDFSGYRPKSFITDCVYYFNKKKYVYYYDGEWGKPAKYGSTYRGVKIGMKKSEVEKLYGELSLKKCVKSKDPFLYDYQFNTSSKKLKVSKYANFSYKTGGKTYNLRIYFTSSKKVFGFILLGGKDFSKISKSTLKRDKRSDMKLI